MIKMIAVLSSLMILPVAAQGGERACIELGPSFWQNSALPFVAFKGEGRFGAGIGMSVQYPSVRSVREQLEKKLGKPLQFFRGWNPQGEAHVTVITPLEYFDVLAERISVERIAELARAHGVQSSDLRVLGIGSGRAEIEGRPEETYFLIVESRNIRRIRRAIHEEFVAKGGSPAAWNPERYFPHVTIGFTRRDLHESDGILKDAEHSLDNRFRVVPGRCKRTQ